MAEGLVSHPKILNQLFGPGTSELRIVHCVLNALPFATVEPINGVHFIDDSSLRRFFDSPVFNVVTSSPTGRTSTTAVGTRRIWADSRPTADDPERLIRRPPQAQLALRQIKDVEVRSPIGDKYATTRRCTSRPMSMLASAAAMLELAKNE